VRPWVLKEPSHILLSEKEFVCDVAVKRNKQLNRKIKGVFMKNVIIQ
jgi:hypothetical protein